MLDPATFPRGPAGILLPPSPLQISQGEVGRLRAAIRRAQAFADSVNSTIANNANPHKFWRQEQVRLARAVHDAVAFVERVHSSPRSPSPHDLTKRAHGGPRGTIDVRG